MRTMSMFWGRAFLLLAAGPLAGVAADKSTPAPAPAPHVPDQREVWVPSNQLAKILASHPNAVVLSREQYTTLLRDAKLDPKAKPTAPRRAALTAARYQSRLVGKVVQVTAAFTVNVLSDEWSQVTFNFQGASVGSVQVDGEAAFEQTASLMKTKGGSEAMPTALLLRGRGERVVTVELTIPVTLQAGLSRLSCLLPAAGASAFQLVLPPGQRIESAHPVRITNTPEATTAAVGISPENPVLDLSWRSAGAGEKALEPLVMVNGIYTIDAERVRVEYGFAIETQLGNLADAYQLALPENSKVLQVTGDEVAKWDVADGRLRVTLQPGERPAANFWLAVEMPSLANAPSATLTLFVPRIEGLGRMQGALSIVGDAGVLVKAVGTDTTVQPSERAIDPTPYFAGSYQFNAAPSAPRVTVEKMPTHFSVDLDTRVAFRPEAIFIDRTLTLHQEKGETFQVAVTLPAGEEVISVRQADDSEPDWRMENGKLRIRWSERPADRTPVFKICTRSEPPNWTQLGLDGLTFTLGDAKIDGAEKITGYIALTADESFRLEAAPSETLERRDGRTTPVQGEYAWFRRQDFTLTVKVAKRPGEVLAALTGYALPLEGVLDLHAQIGYQFLHSGTRSVRIQVPEKLGQNFYFDGPQIAERNLNGDVWTIVFQKELTGEYALTMTAQVPVEKSGPPRGPGNDASQPDAESRFQTTVPLIVPLDVVRTSGVWAVEANTETEIQFEAKGMNELDSLLAPRLPDYQPRHRVIGVFAWLGKDYTLTLSGVRHAPAKVLTSVVDLLELDTVVSTSGVERNQATFQLRTAGAQFLDVQLPAKSRLLSLTVDDELVKPVGDRPGQVRVQLSARRDATKALAVSVLYETPKGEWDGTGLYAAHAPRLAREIPILRSTWRLYLPEGFEYTGLKSNLRVPAPDFERPLVLGPLSLYDEWRVQHAMAVLSGSGISDPRAMDEELPPHLLAEAYRRKGNPELNLEKVKQLFVEAQGFYDTGRFDLAKKRCEQILGIDSANIAARLMEERIDRQKTEYGQAGYNEARAAAIGQIDLAWQSPIRRTADDAAERMNRKLDRVIIPKLEFREATIREALDFLKKKSMDLDEDSPSGTKGVNIVLAPGIGAPDAPGVANPADARITVSLSNIPLREALKYVTGLANLKFRVEPYAVSVVPISENTEVLVTKEWKIPSDLIPRPPGDGGGPADRETAKNWLIANGVIFNGQASAIYIVRSGRLIARNTQDQLDLIDTIIETSVEKPEPPRKRLPNGQMDEANRSAGMSESLRRKLDRIIIPKLEFREATLREAVDFLKKKSVDLDDESPAGKKGINIVLKLESSAPPGLPAPPANVPGVPGLDPVPRPAQPAPAPAPVENPADARITVTLTNIPLYDALRYVAGLANLKVKVEPFAVSLVPITENTEVLVTKEWKMPPDLIPRTPGAAGNPAQAQPADGVVDRESAKNWLIANGLTFNGQASAIYIVRSSRLIVRNTQDQIDLIDTIISTGAKAEPQQAAAAGEEPAGVSGLMPMKLELPKVGRMIELEGLTAADGVEFRYDDWWNRARRLWLWFVGGGLLGLFLAGSRPWWRTCWVLLLLTFFPYCVSMAAIPVCNALLGGWLISVVLQRFVVRMVLAPRRKEVLA